MIAIAPSQILAGHWLTVAQGDNSAVRDWRMILTQSDSLLVQSDWSISNITRSEIPGVREKKERYKVTQREKKVFLGFFLKRWKR